MPAQTFSAPASTDALLAMADQCVQCGLCLPHCPTYRLDASEAESPRGRIAYVKAITSGFLEASALGDRHLDNCLGCRRCEIACPANVPYEALLIEARYRQHSRLPPGFARLFHLAMLARPKLLNVLLHLYRAAFPLLPRRWRPLPRPDAQVPAMATDHPETAALFTGCIAGSYESAARASLIRLLSAVGIKAWITPDQTCCGTAARHAGMVAQSESLAAANRAAFSKAGLVLTLASGCHDRLQQCLTGTAKVQDALSYLAEHAASLRFRSAASLRVALHLPCSQRVNGDDAALRRLLALVPDLEVVELPDTGCCGAAGLHMLAEPERSAALRAPLLAALANSGASQLLSANIGCRLHLGNGSNLPIRHPVELLAEHLA
jgi:glycolate oxidase iron-sulfur subunit